MHHNRFYYHGHVICSMVVRARKQTQANYKQNYKQDKMKQWLYFKVAKERRTLTK